MNIQNNNITPETSLGYVGHPISNSLQPLWLRRLDADFPLRRPGFEPG
jgi:hypothetical protein